ncbi:beta-lactamase/transpeptidase-like protein [Gymnopus androsaceus JB14]|uniref:Beta-lactamase/transpeptidase-like protein n=1 Tax=Gymnopus androsaceus JB14 TaxID=1447944 RepID=A0A6A4GYH9_9AGAR|nr:beta-lactamase/transpeptidase-like protein [Gymnopus androsaceus JB14]
MYISQLIVSIGFSATAALAAIQAPFLAPESTVKQDVLSPEIDTFIEKILADWNSPGGVGIAVVQKNEDGSWNVETKGYGVAKADGSKVTADTLFAIGSNSKLFDIIATGLLISNESLSPRISWNTKISSIIPEWEMSDPVASSESTIIDLMSHRTGLPGYDEVYYEKQSLSSLISKIKYLRPSAGFRETWQYNNMMYTTLSYIPEVLLKVPFTRYVKEHIFLPLNLTSTTYSADIAEESGNLANGFEREGVNKTEDIFGEIQPRIKLILSLAVLSGAGGIISSAKDVATWLQTLLLEGKNPANDEQVIPSAVIQKVATGITVVDGTTPYPELAPSLYGGGQLISSYRGHSTCFHTQITRFPFDNFGVAVLSNDNSYGTLFMRVIKWRIVDQVLGLEPVDWNSRYKNQAIKAYEKEVQDSVPRPADPTPPSVSFSSLQGRYHNPAYGILDLCGILPSISSSELKFKLQGFHRGAFHPTSWSNERLRTHILCSNGQSLDPHTFVSSISMQMCSMLRDS